MLLPLKLESIMAFTRNLVSLALAVGAAALTSTTWAVEDEAHSAHHRKDGIQVAQSGATPVAPAAVSPVMPAMAARSGMGGSPEFNQQIAAMREMHDKMMKAGSAAERQALMGEHMALMNKGMDMMHRMVGRDPAPSSTQEQTRRQGVMEQRMDMMQSMIQMMMDRMGGADPAGK
jgi:hypothetical protein